MLSCRLHVGPSQCENMCVSPTLGICSFKLTFVAYASMVPLATVRMIP